MSNKTIFLTGGGTLGSVTPLLAVFEEWKKNAPDINFIWIGTPSGPEKALVSQTGLKFFTLNVPKAYRYVTWKWLLFPILLFSSFVKSALLLHKYRPEWILSAGAYVSVPLVWLAPVFGSRAAIHQLDIRVGLANKLMAPFSSVITLAWPSSSSDFPHKTVHVVGSLSYSKHLAFNPTSSDYEHFNLDSSKKTVMIVGGGGGSRALNALAEVIADKLSLDFNVLHSTGRGKMIFLNREAPKNYHAVELFVEDYASALSLADVVVTRAGMGQIDELASCGKAAIFIPLPHSPQEDNAKAILDAEAGIVINQDALTGEDLMMAIKKALDGACKKNLERNISNLFHGGGAHEVVELIKQKTPR
jgi:UDP-N-acetylglucosamine--N-acetylmuramyl-(pentapeptide) pyrophosphoryl-undecaprenol N-acetylglucosamine transferase